MLELRITGLGTYLPEHQMSNAELLARHPALTPADAERVGVLRRGVASEREDVPSMAVSAGTDALARAGLMASTLDFVILVNWSERRYVPDLAPLVQARLGATHAFAFDVNAACSGFLVALSIAHGYLQTGRFQRGLVVASDRSLRRVRRESRASLLFGDAAAAAVVEAGHERGWKLVDYELCTDGTRNGLMNVDADGFLESHVRQRDLNELAVSSLLRAGRRLLERNGLTFLDCDYIVPHSGTAGIQTLLASVLELPRSMILTNLPIVGNVVAASIPIALRHFVDQGTLRPGHRVLVLAVGLGWQYVAGLVEL
jgi:3-oxoacyl-[acyl-carrier-protein] synthase III